MDKLRIMLGLPVTTKTRLDHSDELVLEYESASGVSFTVKSQLVYADCISEPQSGFRQRLQLLEATLSQTRTTCLYFEGNQLKHEYPHRRRIPTRNCEDV